MNKQEQIDRLQFRIERIEAKLAEQHISNNFSKLNPSEKPNSCEPDYTHLLPEGYEFCSEEDAEKWVKVEMDDSEIDYKEQTGIGSIINYRINKYSHNFYRPIRPIKYHVAIHESVTAEPDPYQVDWEKAPEGKIVTSHSFDSNGQGNWYGIKHDSSEWYVINISSSNFTLPSGLDWKKSLRVNPKLK